VGAGDCQARGVSTFMAEMLETGAILRGASSRCVLLRPHVGLFVVGGRVGVDDEGAICCLRRMNWSRRLRKAPPPGSWLSPAAAASACRCHSSGRAVGCARTTGTRQHRRTAARKK
jgi:hypothetical protein